MLGLRGIRLPVFSNNYECSQTNSSALKNNCSAVGCWVCEALDYALKKYNCSRFVFSGRMSVLRGLRLRVFSNKYECSQKTCSTLVMTRVLKRNCNRFAIPASPEFSLTCAELMLADLTMLIHAELNDIPSSDIIEHKLHGKSLMFHVPLSNVASITKGKVSNRHAAATDDLSNIDSKSELK